MKTILKVLEFQLLKTVLCCAFISYSSIHLHAQCSSTATDVADEEILKVTFGTLSNTSTCATTGGAGSTLNMYSNYTAVAAPNVVKCSSVSYSVQIGTCGGNFGNAVAIFIDWNNDNDFLDAGETAYNSAASTTGPHTESGTITIPGNAALGNIHMRVVNVETGTPSSITSCGTYSWGETEDYLINVTAGAALAYTSSTVTQIVSGSVTRCDNDRQIICVPIVMGAGCSSNLTQFQLGAGSSTNLLADVSKIHIYYTGTTNTFSASNEFVAGGTSPAGAANTINGTQALVSGTNYFWICYDMNAGATAGNIIDGSCTQLTIAAVNQVPTVTNPAGSATIATCTTPGGVGGTSLWLKANAGTNTVVNNANVSSWISQAAAPALTVTQATAALQPIYRIGSGTGTNNLNNRFNYNPFIYTDGTSNRLTSLGDINLGTTTSGMSVYQVIAEDLGIVSLDWYHTTNGNVKMKGDGLVYINDAAGTVQQNVAVGTTLPKACMLTLRGTPGNIVSPNGRNDGVTIASYANGWRVATQNGISIGSNMDNGEFMQGGMGEFIFFPSILTTANNLKVESYLAIKYGITLGTNAAVSNYTSTSGTVVWAGFTNYQNNILGIARDDNSGLLQKQSHQYDDSVRIYKGALAATSSANASTFASDASYVVMGSNTGKLCNTSASNSEMPIGLASCTLYSRLEREWRVTRTNMAETYNMDVTLGTCGAPASVTVTDLRLLVDDDGNFANGGTQCYYNGDGTGIVFSYSNPIITVSNISTTHIPNNVTKFITIASINAATPLPVQLMYFNAEKDQDQRSVDLTWETQTEINSYQFVVEKSTDMINWSVLAVKPAAGNSSSAILYSEIDPNPSMGTNYYRLRLIDNDGSTQISEVRAVDFNWQNEMSVYPNPTTDNLHINGDNLRNAAFRLWDNTGRTMVFTPQQLSDNHWVIDFTNLTHGIYYLEVIGSNGTEVIKVNFIL